MVDAETKATVQKLPMLSSKACPRDGEGAWPLPGRLYAWSAVLVTLTGARAPRSQSGSIASRRSIVRSSSISGSTRSKARLSAPPTTCIA